MQERWIAGKILMLLQQYILASRIYEKIKEKRKYKREKKIKDEIIKQKSEG